MTFSAEIIAQIYVQEIVCLYGVPVFIKSDCGSVFTLRFGREFQEKLGTRVDLSTTFHPQTDGQSKQTIQDSYEIVRVIQDRLRVALSRQKAYADRRLRALRFRVGDCVFLRVSPMRGVMRFKRKGKLSPRYIGPFENLCMNYILDYSHVLRWDSVQLDDQLTFVEEPVLVLACDVKRLRTREIPVVKVQWGHRPVEKATWEIENCIIDSIDCGRESFSERKEKARWFMSCLDSRFEYGGMQDIMIMPDESWEYVGIVMMPGESRRVILLSERELTATKTEYANTQDDLKSLQSAGQIIGEPCIIFIDDIDAISGCHFREGTSADREIQRILMELLNQLDGFDQLRKIKLIMETNRPDVLDPTLLRPGWLDRKIEIPLLNEQSRMEILKIHVVGIDKHGDMRLLLSSLRVLMGLICVIFCTICGLHPSVICLDAC
ncbi:hypothetical protein FXO37_08490 [Capsicum annuum]|nr:hypothetical protein FXO37_08490 [Capsicum annuum]